MLSAPVSSLHKTDSGFVQMLAFGRSGREQAHFWFSEHVSSPKIKNISLFQKAKSVVHSVHPALLRRASAVVTNVGRVAVDARFALRRWRRSSVRQNRVVLAPVAGVKLSGRRELNGSDGVNQELVSGEITA